MRNKRKIIIISVITIILILGITIISINGAIPLFGNGLNLMNASITQKTVGAGLESAYIEWDNFANADGYNVYISNQSGGYTQLDNELIRLYKDGSSSYWRADAVGLKAGNYKFKVVPIVDGNEDTASQVESENITVEAHDRTGFAWVNGDTTGAYNLDGTIKDNANIIYVTEDTKNTVSLDVQTSSSGKVENAQGLQNILDLYKKGYESKPLVVRIIGKVTDPETLEGGDIVISGNGSDNRIDCGITFEGIGEDATLYGYGIRLKNASNVEIRNIAVMLTDSNEGDNIGLQQENDHVWVHNCDFFYGEAGSDSDQAKGDGALDCKKSTYITFSYNHFFDTGKSNLLGLSENTTDDLYITYHHNWYDHSDSRHPRIRFYSAHVYNNYYDGNSKYGVGACLGSSVLVEGNYFRNCKKPMMISMQGSDTSGTFSKEDGGMIKAYNNYMIGQESYIPYSQDNENFDAYEVSSIDEQVPSSVTSLQGGNTYNNFDTSSIMYDYNADSPEEAKTKVEKYAGRLNGGDFKWEFNDSEDDESDKLNEELKNALENYESNLLSVGGDSIDMPEEPSTEPDVINVESVSLNSQTGELRVGEKITLIATITPDNATNKSVTWKSDNTEVAIVDNGIVTAVGEGKTNITVTTVDGNKTATCAITVLPEEEPEPTPDPEPEVINVESVSLNSQSEELEIGEQTTLVATITPDNATNKSVTWSSDNTSVATVDNGVVRAVGEGNANITVTTVDGNKTAVCEITVLPKEEPEPEPDPEPEVINVESVALNTQSEELEIGDTVALVATISPSNATNKNVTWSSDNTSVATVDNGLVTAIGEGKTNITVTTVDGNKTAVCEITVLPKEEPEITPDPEPEVINVESVALNIQNTELKTGETVTLVATITPSDATNKNITWSSDNTNVATVNNGIVTAVGEGTANITVTTEDGNKTAVCEITVIEEQEDVISTISYDITDSTNKNVTATITFNRNDVTITNNDGSNQYVFEANGEFTFEYVDSEGNSGTNTARVNWIDKEAPVLEVEYENINDGKEVKVTIKSNEELTEIEGWELSEDRMSMFKTFNANENIVIEVSDLVGNITETTINVDSIQNSDNNDNGNDTNDNDSDNKEDNTVASGKLPYTGFETIVKIFIGLAIVGSIVFYIGYKKIQIK